MFEGASLNDINFAAVPELIARQPVLVPGGAMAGIVGTPYQSGSAAITSRFMETDQNNAPSPYGWLSDMQIGGTTIYEPQTLPVGLYNGVYSHIGEGAAL